MLISAIAGNIPRMAGDTLASRIQKRLDRLGISARKASLAAGMGADGIRNILNGKSKRPLADNLHALAKALECNPEYLLGHKLDESLATAPDLPPDTLPVPPGYLPVLSIIIPAKMGGGRLIEADIIGPPRWYDEDLILHVLRARPEDLRTGEVEGQSMEPLLHNRDRVIIDVRKKSLSEPGLFYLWDGDGLVCKWVQRIHGSEPLKLKIISENKTFEPYEILAEQAQIIGRVVWYARRL